MCVIYPACTIGRKRSRYYFIMSYRLLSRVKSRRRRIVSDDNKQLTFDEVVIYLLFARPGLFSSPRVYEVRGNIALATASRRCIIVKRPTRNHGSRVPPKSDRFEFRYNVHCVFIVYFCFFFFFPRER